MKTQHIHAIIIDDEPHARQSLQLLVEEFCPQVHILESCSNLPEGVKAIHKHKPKLVFLDIEMPGHSGLELLDFFEDEQVNFYIIFTTAYHEYAIKAFKFSAIDYLLKPINPAELEQAIGRLEKLESKKQNFQLLKENLTHNLMERIAVPVLGSLELLLIKNIVFFKSDGAYTVICMKDGTCLTVSKNLKNFEELVQNDPRFVRCHRSYIVNIACITSIKRTEGLLCLTNHSSIPVAQDKINLIVDSLQVVKKL